MRKTANFQACIGSLARASYPVTGVTGRQDGATIDALLAEKVIKSHAIWS